MKFVIAPDKFKNSITSMEFCMITEKSLRSVFPKAMIASRPLADGGDGSVEVMSFYKKAEIVTAQIRNPLEEKTEAKYLFYQKEKMAFIEAAEACGVKTLKKTKKWNCTQTTTKGVGELILHAIKKGATTILLSIGGTATNEAGLGMAEILGYQFLNDKGEKIDGIAKNLPHIKKILYPVNQDIFSKVAFQVLYDVSNPMYGDKGATKVYAKQKNASSKQIQELEKGIKNISTIFAEKFDMSQEDINSSGAGGALVAGSMAFLRAKKTSGIDFFKKIAELDKEIKNAEWVITGEGCIDEQTFFGKTLSGVFQTAKKYKKPVAVFCGVNQLNIKQQEELGIYYLNAIIEQLSQTQLRFSHTKKNLVASVYNFAKLLKYGLS